MASQESITLVVNFPGQANNVVPRLCRLQCTTATLAEVKAAGFLDNYLQANSVALLPTDFVLTVATDDYGMLKPVFTNGSCQLVDAL